MNPNTITLPSEHLQAAGFVLQTELPSGTRYEAGQLYMRLAESGTVRLFLPYDCDQMEISSGNIYEPHIHYTGAIGDVHQLLGFIDVLIH